MERVRPMQLLARSQRVSQSTLLLLNREHHAEATAAAIASHTAQRRSNVYPGFSWYARFLWLFQWYVVVVSSFHARCVPPSSVQACAVCASYAKTAFGSSTGKVVVASSIAYPTRQPVPIPLGYSSNRAGLRVPLTFALWALCNLALLR